jgi:hypothetical protein
MYKKDTEPNGCGKVNALAREGLTLRDWGRLDMKDFVHHRPIEPLAARTAG